MPFPMRPEDLLLAADLTLVGASRFEPGLVVHLRGDRIRAISPQTALPPEAPVRQLPGCVLLPGLVNAHQHGRGVSQVLLGLPDDALEPWIARRLGRASPDVAKIIAIAAGEMLRHGVTTCVHANYAYGENYEQEARIALTAYAASGIDVTFCVGAQDRGRVLYPPEDEAKFLARLSPDARALLTDRAPPYAGDAAATIALMGRLEAEWGHHPNVTLAYGPANPLWVGNDLLSAIARDAERRGCGLHTHVAESPAQARANARMFPDGVAAHLERLGALHSQVTLAHGTHLTTRDLDVIAEAGARIAINLGSNLRLRNGIAPMRAALNAGIELALGTDDTALSDDADLLGELQLAAALVQRDGHALAADEQFDMVTAFGARAAFRHDAGEIRVGARANLAAFALEPWLGDDAEPVLARLRGRNARLTIVGGVVAFDADARDSDLADRIEQIRRAAAIPADHRRRAAAEEVADALRNHYKRSDCPSLWDEGMW